MDAPIDLIIQYCNAADPARAVEYDECVRRNLANPHVRAIHNLMEPHTILPQEFAAHPKLRIVHIDRWLRFSDAFAFANLNLAGKVVCLCNLDIFLDPSGRWPDAALTARQNVVLCLSRTEYESTGKIFEDPELQARAFCNSQDAWIWHAPLEVPQSDFEIGTMGCDNAIAHRFKQTGRIPINAASRFRIFHYDQARGKSFANQHKVHGHERNHRAEPRPELDGYLLLPDIDRLKSLDDMMRAMNIPEVSRYVAICNVLGSLMHPAPREEAKAATNQ